MKSLMIAVFVLALIPGCGSQFKDDKEELAYLSSLSNPTPSQWQRKNALEDEARKKMEEHEAKEEAINAALRKASLEIQKEEEAKKVRAADEEAARSWDVTAASWDKAGDKAKADEARQKAAAIRKTFTP